MTKKWMLGLLAATAVAAVAVAVAIGSTAGASGATSAQSRTRPEGQWQQLMKNKEFRDEYFALRRAQLDDQQAWWDKYASDPQSSDAETAMQQLRQKEQAAMQALFKKYGVTPPAAPQGLQQLRKLKDNAQFQSDAGKLRDQFRSDMQAWYKKYGSHPQASAAVSAMDKLRATYQSQLKVLLKKYGVTISGDLPLAILGRDLMGGGRGHGWFGGPDGLDGGGDFGFGHGGMMRGMPFDGATTTGGSFSPV